MTPLQGIAETLLGTLPPPRPPKAAMILDAFGWVDRLPDRFTTHDVARVLGVENAKATQCITNAMRQKLAVREGEKTVIVNGKHLAIYVKTHRQRPEPKTSMNWVESFSIDAEFTAMELANKFNVTRWVARTMVKNAAQHQLIVCTGTQWRRGGWAYTYKRTRA